MKTAIISFLQKVPTISCFQELNLTVVSKKLYHIIWCSLQRKDFEL